MAKSCSVQADVTNPVVRNQPYDQLDITLLTTPEPASGPEYVFLTFTKIQYRPAADYQLTAMRYRTTGGPEVTYPLNAVTLQEDRGSYSGTLSGTASNGIGTATLAITNGAFTGARP